MHMHTHQVPKPPIPGLHGELLTGELLTGELSRAHSSLSNLLGI